LLERVAATIVRHQMFHSGQKTGVAVSGGADSVCLLHVLRELAPRWNLHLSVLHLNHGLRGAESDEDAAFVGRLAAEFGLPFVLRRAELATTDDNLEQAGRQARLDFFGEVIANGSVDRIALGHTRSDQAETVLFRFLRGAGTAGLAGIRPVTAAGIVRPLVAVDRAEVEQFLRERGIPWREDSSNRSPEFARNRIRHELLPALARDWNPAIVRSLSHTADWALAEESYWEAEIDRLGGRHLISQNGFVLLQTGCLKELPLAAARRLVRRAIEMVRGDLRSIDFAHIAAVLEMATATEGHGRLQAPNLDVMRSFDWLRFGPIQLNGLQNRNYRLAAPVPGVVRVPGSDRVLSLEIVEKSEYSENGECVYNMKETSGVDWEKLAGPLDLRNWRPGDQYQPLGNTGEEKIKTLFQQFRIPLWERRHWPVLTDGQSIVWTRRFGPDARLAAQPGARKILMIREIGIGPGQDYVYMNIEGRQEVS
jgi:tRNA(Ile)-lysidine synthase